MPPLFGEQPHARLAQSQPNPAPPHVSVAGGCLGRARLRRDPFTWSRCGSRENALRGRAVPAHAGRHEEGLLEPFFKHLAQVLGVEYDLVVTNDWAGIATALANGQADVAWMGPWGYVLAHNEGGAEAIATVKYDGRPTYHAIIVGRPDLTIATWPEDAKGLSISFADVGSTSGWLVPTYWFKTKGIDPKTYFKYREGASHPANETAVANGQVDLATDYDRNYNAMIERGLIKADQVKIVWTSDPLPNDPLVVRKGLDPAVTKRVQDTLAAITEEQAKTIMPPTTRAGCRPRTPAISSSRMRA